MRSLVTVAQFDLELFYKSMSKLGFANPFHKYSNNQAYELSFVPIQPRILPTKFMSKAKS